MNRKFPRRLALACLLGLLGLNLAVAHAATPASNKSTQDKSAAPRQQLEQIRKEMGTLRQAVTRTRRSQAEVQADLQKLSGEIAARAQTLQQTQTERERTAARLERLRSQGRQLEASLAVQKQHLRGQLRAAYMLGPESPLQLWLNQKNPAELGRTLEYYRRLNQARLQRIEAIEATAGQVARTSAQIHDQHQQLMRVESRVAQQQKELEQRRQARQQVAAELQDTLKQQQQRLGQLQANAKALDRLLARLAAEAARRAKLEAERAARIAKARAAARKRQELALKRAREENARRRQAGLAPKPEPAAPTAAAEASAPALPKIVGRGQLPAPVSGPISVRFGTPRGQGGMPWQGVVFQAPPGSPVQAVAAGRVVYASALRGYGLLLILDHGNGLLSLYSHVQGMLKGAGAQVEAGERIAAVGQSAELGQPGLYFEMRQHGRPVDPLRYLRLR
ncbi:MAG: murein hydrolase activator EnvC family protein [Pseudomonadota bacterium]